ncbi:unnamed protein product [Phytomonas sp. EM1]|nr:unnamed protein product [Phytomonas sp. EM1]|eukprot:CCW63967.1 unnamed protein product [Phytomonas sp. isolate EM1]
MLENELSKPKGVSRFRVLFSQPGGTKKQRRWVEGFLVVGHDASYLYDTENHSTVAVSRGSSVRPNPVFQTMQNAHNGLDWTAAQSETLSVMRGYAVQIIEVMELHLIPYATPTATDRPRAAHGTEGCMGPDPTEIHTRSPQCGGVDLLPEAVSSSPRRFRKPVPMPRSASPLGKRSRSEIMRSLAESYAHYFYQ